MMLNMDEEAMTRILAFEGGATQTRAGLYDHAGSLLGEVRGGPSNPVECGLDACVATLISLGRELLGSGTASSAAAGVAGASRSVFREAVAERLASAFSASRVVVTDDLRPLLFANAGKQPAILAIAGTGSSVLAQDGAGDRLLLGGKGPLLSDDGSAYRLVERALRAATSAFDGAGPATVLQTALLDAVAVDGYTELAVWLASAAKMHVAQLAAVVCAAAAEGDAIARECIRGEAFALAALVLAAHRRLALPDAISVFINGGLFRSCEGYRAAFEAALAEGLPGAGVRVPERRSHEAAFALAVASDSDLPDGVSVFSGMPSVADQPPTEQRVAGERTLDTMTAVEIVRYMNEADQRCIDAIGKAKDAIAQVMEAAAQALQSGGRLVYLGAGTSGRLGVLDASECPPTFGVAADRVVGIMAGGDVALRNSREGSEDDRSQGAADLDALTPPVGKTDVVVGIAASGTTPYVIAGLEHAAERGATTALICCNPACTASVDVLIVLDTGPEVLTGSTRLKAGTSTKMALNMISTGAMALSGYVYEGLMVGVQATNVKLRRRAARIVAALTDLAENDADVLLETAEYEIPVAVLMARRGLAVDEARACLAKGGSLRAALSD